MVVKQVKRTLCAVAFALPVTAALAVPVDTELSLLIDVSGSVSSTEFLLQQQGYVDAFNNPDVVDAIQGGANGRIAANVIYWSSAGAQSQSVGWTEIFDTASASSFAAAIAATPRPFRGATAPGSAIAFADPLFDNNGFEGTRHVIDVSGDGAENSGLNTAGARDVFLAGGGSAINGIVISPNADLLSFYQNSIQGGAGSFTLSANSFEDFGDVIDDKLVREISNEVPEPAALALFAMGLLGYGGARLSARKS